MYAVVVSVNIPSGQFDKAKADLRSQVIPRVSQMPGFVQGFWTADDQREHGSSLVVFQTREQAQDAATRIRSTPAPGGVTIANVQVGEIVGDAKAAAV